MNITDLLSAKARVQPDAPAIISPGASLSYYEFDRAVSWVAQGYRKKGVEPGDAVGIQLSNQLQKIIASMAFARLGAVQIPISKSDPLQVQIGLQKRLGLDVVVSDGGAFTNTEISTISGPPEDFADYKDIEPVVEESLGNNQTMYLIVATSGTTSPEPKLGLLSHEAAVNRSRLLSYDKPDNRFLSLVDFEFIGARQNYIRCINSGAAFILNELLTPDNLADAVLELNINYIACARVHADSLVQISTEGVCLFPQINALRVSSTIIPDVSRREYMEKLTPNLYVGFGISETGMVSLAGPESIRNTPGIVGSLTPGNSAKIVDDAGAPLPPGEIGELFIKSEGTITNYIDPAGSHSEDLRNNWFDTGDLAEFTDSNALIHHGRKDDLIIFDGINIYPAQIENVLYRHPAVVEAAAFSIPSVSRGEEPHAAVILNEDLPMFELMRHCRSWLCVRPPVHIERVSKLPKNAAGKVINSELRLLVASARKN